LNYKFLAYLRFFGKKVIYIAMKFFSNNHDTLKIEYVALPRGFIFAGVPNVITSLWSVHNKKIEYPIIYLIRN